MNKLLYIVLIFAPFVMMGQSSTLKGDILDEKGMGLGFATVAILHPSDSTLAFFGITNAEGHFEIRNTKPGEYLMQVAYLGYQILYRPVKLPLEKGDDLGAILLKPTPINLREVEVTSDHIPLLIKKDTIEYNAAAFKTKPDAVAEDLLRKLPGIDVDRSGNIKAIGKDVKNVLVDGKEFFGNDLKVATKNVPADAIKKIQVYDKKSEESEFTGINDGTQEKTINLQLKDDKKKAIFGDLMAGIGTEDHFQGSAKVYRFTGKTQFAALGMINNINQFGFSFSDYLSFNGGIGALSGSGSARITMTSDNSFPVNFGQPVIGDVTSGAAGLNFSHEPRKDNRFFFSYLGNGSETYLSQKVYSQNFLPGSSYDEQKQSSSTDQNWVHRLTFGWKNRIDSTQRIDLSGGITFTNGFGSGESAIGNIRNDSLINSLQGSNSDHNERIAGNIRGSYIKKIRNERTNIKLSGTADYSDGLSKIQWSNLTHYYFPDFINRSEQYQKSKTERLNTGASLTITQKLFKNFYLEPIAEMSYSFENLDRKQSNSGVTEQPIDSLSPLFSTNYLGFQPALRFKLSTRKTTLSVTAGMEIGKMTNKLINTGDVNSPVTCFTPGINYEYEYSRGQRLALAYESAVNLPTVNQLLPVVNNINPTTLVYGNRLLNPENIHRIYFNWWLFDQFSFTSVFTSLNFSTTRNKINWAMTVNDSLGQSMILLNVPEDYDAGLSVDFSTPVKKLGLTIHASIRENWNRGITYVNNIENVNTNLTHRITLSIDNRKKEKWDVNIGATFTLTDSRYTVQESMNKTYFDLGYFGELRFTPNERWSFAANADVTNYNARTFNDMVNIPLIGAEISFYFLKNNRGILTFSGFDLLNKNTGIERISEMNYLRETRSNTIGRYLMLSFKYRLNKFRENTGIDIKVNNRN